MRHYIKNGDGYQVVDIPTDAELEARYPPPDMHSVLQALVLGDPTALASVKVAVQQRQGVLAAAKARAARIRTRLGLSPKSQ